MKASEHELWQDEIAAKRRERDRSREPSLERTERLRLTIRPSTALVPIRTVRLECPMCSGPVFATSGRHRSEVGCVTCFAELSTRLFDGSVTLVPAKESP